MVQGVETFGGRFGDSISKHLGPHPEHYESCAVNALRKSVSSGDKVVVVGGGIGVTAIVAAKEAGSHGSISVFEQNPKRVKIIAESAHKNDVENIVDIFTARVAETDSHTDRNYDEKILEPEEVPTCDVLELDCEGAELEILESMTIRPQTIIVESHGFLGVSSDRVKTLLNKMGYDVIDTGLAESGLASGFCRRNDIRVHRATRSDINTDTENKGV